MSLPQPALNLPSSLPGASGPSGTEPETAQGRRWRFDQHDCWYLFEDCCVLTGETVPAQGEVSLVFLHGRYGQSETWLGVIDALAAQYHCVWLDFPGFGRSFCSSERGLALVEMAELVRLVIDRLCVPDRRVVLVGHDFGGSVAQLCLARDPERISGLVLLNCAGLSEPTEGLRTGWFGWRCRRELGRLLRSASRNLSEAMRQNLLQPWLCWSARSSLVHAFRGLDQSWPGHYERLEWKRAVQRTFHPVLLLWGKRDFLNPVDRGVRLLQDFPESEFHEQEECGHWPNLERPDWVAARLREFVFRLGPRRA